MNPATDQTIASARKPRLALIGEFSAGKSTLTNLLTGRDALPVRITATCLPPVWISKGEQAVTIVGPDGVEKSMNFDELESVSVETATLIKVQLPSETLELCDIIDMPGISDPNMASSIWQSVVHEADSVVWCTHATQAWRQSEAAVWEQISGSLKGRNILLLTHIDKLQNARERDRVLQRVRKEAGSHFDAIFPVALTDAVAAGEDEEKWNRSGAGPFVEYLIDTLMDPSLRDLPSKPQAVPKEGGSMKEVARFATASAGRDTQEKDGSPVALTAVVSEEREAIGSKGRDDIVPKRVRVPQSDHRMRSAVASERG